MNEIIGNGNSTKIKPTAIIDMWIITLCFLGTNPNPVCLDQIRHTYIEQAHCIANRNKMEKKVQQVLWDQHKKVVELRCREMELVTLNKEEK